ncbi:MAG: ABC transporter ATP-binding protein [Apilactobacillus waqarii]|uniref:ABC transporter ATP-binding protein n=1 Tax=Apilactobacillus waqarii TaxID=2851006 RepID=UPI003F3B81FC
MSYIDVNHISYIYKVFKKKTGFKGMVVDFFNRKYTDKNVLKDISFHVKKGEKVGLLGPNGAGKSTLIKLMTGIISPQDGEILFDGIIPNTNNYDFLNKIGVVMGQKSQLNPNLSAMDTFNLIRDIYKIRKEDYRERLHSYLTMFELNDVKNYPVRKLSLGERTKLEIIASLLHSPEVLILDEPTLGMDIVSQNSLYDFINQINERLNVTIFIISHQMRDIENITDRILILLNGSIAFDGDTDELLTNVSEKTPVITVMGKNSNPIISLNNADVSVNGNDAKISKYNLDSTITLKLSELSSLTIEDSSLEESVYKIFKEEKS